MKVIHFSDTHLGLSQSNTLRENDFYDNFESIINDIISIKPDFVIHTWDLFHHAKPSNKAISVAVSWLVKLSEAWIPTIIIAWNHDTPRLSSTTHPFEIFNEFEHVHAVFEPKTHSLDFKDIRFICLPHIHDEELFRNELWTSDTHHNKEKTNIYLSHFWLQAKEYDEYTDEITWVNILMDDLKKLQKYDYVALWHYHKNFWFSNIQYAGSIEHTSFNQRNYKLWYNVLTLEKDWKITCKTTKISCRKMIDLWEIDCDEIDSTPEIIQLLDSQISKDFKNSILKVSFINMSPKLLLEFQDKLIVEYFKNAFSFEYRKHKIAPKNNTKLSTQVDLNNENFVENIFSSFMDDYELDKKLDKDKLKNELLDMIKTMKT